MIFRLQLQLKNCSSPKNVSATFVSRFSALASVRRFSALSSVRRFSLMRLVL